MAGDDSELQTGKEDKRVFFRDPATNSCATEHTPNWWYLT
jgi:hypothetical protein